MDNSGTNTNGPVTPPSNLSVPSGTAGPKVFDLSSVNSLNSNQGNNFLKKKPFIIGILSVLLLVAVSAVGTYYYFIKNQPTSTKTKADDCLVVNSTGLNAMGDTAKVEVSITNNCSAPVNVKFKTEKYWCNEVKYHSSGNYITCSDHGVGPWEPGDHDIPPGGTSPKITVEQKIGNNGTCGSAQVDVWYKTPSGVKTGPYFGTAWKEPCNTTELPPFRCLRIDQTPPDTRVTPGLKIKLANSTLGSTGTWQSTWTVTSTGANKGTFENINYNSTFWTAPATLTANQTWNFKVTVKDKSGAEDVTGCTSSVSFTTGTVTYNHNVCNSNQACVSLPCNPVTTDCSLSTDCKTAADCTTTTYKFNTCESNSCVSKNCPDPSQPCAQDNDCDNDNDCKAALSHKICRNEACVVIDGAGTDNCSTDNDCKTTQTHKVCQNEACVVVNGAGTDTCSSDSACKSNPTHKECQNNACVTVNGAGSDSCSSDASCQPEATPPPIPESGNTVLTLGAITAGVIAILGGIFLAF